MRMRSDGAPASHVGPVHVSMNDYLIHGFRDIPLVAREGMVLRHLWPETEGALGLWVGALRGGRRPASGVGVRVAGRRRPAALRPLTPSPADHARVPHGGGAVHERVDG
jgi:hypothetical protein